MSQNACLIHATAAAGTLKMLVVVQISRPGKMENCICENEFNCHDAIIGNFIVFPGVASTYLSSNIVLSFYKLVASKPKPKEIVELMLADDGVLLKMGS